MEDKTVNESRRDAHQFVDRRYDPLLDAPIRVDCAQASGFVIRTSRPRKFYPMRAYASCTYASEKLEIGSRGRSTRAASHGLVLAKLDAQLFFSLLNLETDTLLAKYSSLVQESADYDLDPI